MNPYIDLGWFRLPTYPLAAVAGIICCLLLFAFSGIRFGITTKELCNSASEAYPWGFIGAVTLGLLTKLPHFIEQDISFPQMLINSGIVFYGGLLGVVFGLWLYTLGTTMDLSVYLDAFAPLIPIFHAFGRIGCYLGGCCYGRLYDGIGCVAYPVDGVAANRFPVQLVEAAACLILGCVLLALVGKVKKGNLICVYFVCYALIRFADEFLRGDAIRGIWFGLSSSQWISIAILGVIGVRTLQKHGLIWGRYVKDVKHRYNR